MTARLDKRWSRADLVELERRWCVLGERVEVVAAFFGVTPGKVRDKCRYQKYKRSKEFLSMVCGESGRGRHVTRSVDGEIEFTGEL